MEVDGPRPTLEFGESDGYRKERAGSLSIGAGTYGCTHGSKRLPCSSINPRPLCLCCLCDWQAPTSPRGYTAYRYTALHIAAGFEEKSLAKIHRRPHHQYAVASAVRCLPRQGRATVSRGIEPRRGSRDSTQPSRGYGGAASCALASGPKWGGRKTDGGRESPARRLVACPGPTPPCARLLVRRWQASSLTPSKSSSRPHWLTL